MSNEHVAIVTTACTILILVSQWITCRRLIKQEAAIEVKLDQIRTFWAACHESFERAEEASKP